MKNNRFNRINRIIHWAIAFTLLFLLTTVLLRMGWMNSNGVGDIIQKNLAKSGTQISSKDAVAIAKEVRRPMWQLHYIAGYTMIGLYLLRMVLTAIQGASYKGSLNKTATTKEKFKAWVYIVFYALLAVSMFTGFMTLNGPKSLHSIMSAIHTKSIYYVVMFIIIHIAGVLIADAGTEPGIISKIISGEKPIDNKKTLAENALFPENKQ